MESQTYFEYYDDLEVNRLASEQEITTSYRRLARIHHPDKNPDSVEEATATFQKIQHAYETLSDPIKRQRYDLEQTYVQQTFVDDDLYDDLDDDLHFDEETFWEVFREITRSRTFSFQEHWDEQMRGRRSQAEVELEAEKKAEEARRKAEQEDIEDVQRQLKELIDNERQKQESRWAKFKSTTEDEKIQQCLHSSFCTKVQLKKKEKCRVCHVKRGMTTFVCPHCTASLCQLCVTNFAAKRQKGDKSDEKIPEDLASPEADSEPTVDEKEMKPSSTQAGKDGKGRRQRKTTTNKDKRACYNCGETGHFARDCPEPRRSSKQGPKPAHGGGQKTKQGGGAGRGGRRGGGRGSKAGANRQTS